ncbi:hypothetical protein [Spirosoma endbachense]|uniref:hypothetical protein n=1 Tax=Spirosoma endbachense TaxID=2666025 RepID=UPI001390C929|nr:hypothetical protein [Spirosoma endbachense]
MNDQIVGLRALNVTDRVMFPLSKDKRVEELWAGSRQTQVVNSKWPNKYHLLMTANGYRRTVN